MCFLAKLIKHLTLFTHILRLFSSDFGVSSIHLTPTNKPSTQTVSGTHAHRPTELRLRCTSIHVADFGAFFVAQAFSSEPLQLRIQDSEVAEKSIFNNN